MKHPNHLNPHLPEFERFLYSSVGEDGNGCVVSVLSAFARLGLDPWKETAELASLERDEARTRLEILLSRVRGIPALSCDHGAVARDLSRLLPDRSSSLNLQRVGTALGDDHPSITGVVLTVLAVMFAVYQLLTVGWS